MVADVEAVLDTIRDALRDRRLLHLNYRNYHRLVQPEVLSADGSGNMTLIAWQLSGGCESGQARGRKEFCLNEIAGVTPLVEY